MVKILRSFIKNEKVMLTFISFIAVVFTLFLTFIAGMEGNSIALWSRFFSYFIDAFLLFFSFMIARANQRHNLNLFEFGLEKVESFSGILLSFMVIIYVGIITVAVFYRILHPSPLSPNHFAFYLYLLFVVKDLLLYYRLKRYTQHQRSPLISSQKRYYTISLFCNFIVLFPLVLIYILPKDSLIPMTMDILGAMTLCFLTAYLSYGVGKRAAFDLVDKALDESVQLEILRLLAKNFDLYEQFHGQMTRQTGNTKYIALFFEFDPQKPFHLVMEDIKTLQTNMQTAIPDSQVFIIPATQKIR